MSVDDSSAETGPSINDQYASEFRQHLAHFQAHLAGSDGKRLLPSYIPPTGYWTSLEKDLFFHGLSIHSRFRPDLIAACVRTKTVIDVCAYIDALEEGSYRNTAVHPGRAQIEGAMEVSDAWVQWEQKRSADLTLLECDWEEESLEEKRKDGGKEEIQNSILGRQWIQETTLRRLNVHHLRVMETILRNGQSESGCVPADHSPPSARLPITDEMIDPALLEISGASLSIPDVSYPHSGISDQLSSSLITPDRSLPAQSSQIKIPDPVEETAMNPFELSPASRRRLQKRLYMRKKRAEKTGSEFTSIVTKLRPGRKSRERTSQKKTPKSKNNPCEDDLDEGPMDVDQSMNPHALYESQDQDTLENSELEDDGPSEHARHSKSGLTKPYKIKQEFTSQGIDVDVLSKKDLELFHYSTLSRLMELYKSGYSEPNTSIATTISADTIRLMTAVVVSFASEVVHRTIVFREQEKAMKGNIKVYGRMHDDITPENVDHVLEIMGMKELTKEQHFIDLLDEEMSTMNEARSDLEVDYQEYRGASHGPFDTSPDDDSEGENGSHDKASFPTLLALRHELYPPLVHLPKSFTNGEIPLEDTLTPMDIGDNDLQNELEEEREIDDADGILAKKYETELWKSSGRGDMG